MYEDRKSYVHLDGVYAICEEEVHQEAADENWLVAFVRKNYHCTSYAVAEDIAERIMGSSMSIVFPDVYKKFKDTPGSKKPSAKRTSTKKTKEVVKELDRQCSVDHKNASNFKVVHHCYYFSAESKYSGVACFGCKNYFVTDENKAREDYKPASAIPLPTKKVPAFACVDFELDRCLCGTMLCNTCYQEAVTSSTNSSRKRGRGGSKKAANSSGAGSGKKARRR